MTTEKAIELNAWAGRVLATEATLNHPTQNQIRAALKNQVAILQPLRDKWDQVPKTSRSLPDQVLDYAMRFVGVHEKGGNNKGPEIEQFQRAVDGYAGGEPWCAAFVQYCIKEIEDRNGATSKVFKSEHCLTIWNRTPKSQRLTTPEPGCLVIWRNGKTAQGHVGFVVGLEGKVLLTIEGNTSDGSGVSRDGDGVYKRLRSINSVGSLSIVGYLRVFE